MPKAVAPELLLQAYRDEIVWLKIPAKDYEAKEPSVSPEYVHPANNL